MEEEIQLNLSEINLSVENAALELLAVCSCDKSGLSLSFSLNSFLGGCLRLLITETHLHLESMTVTLLAISCARYLSVPDDFLSSAPLSIIIYACVFARVVGRRDECLCKYDAKNSLLSFCMIVFFPVAF